MRTTTDVTDGWPCKKVQNGGAISSGTVRDIDLKPKQGDQE